jgi:hypothetical protein
LNHLIFGPNDLAAYDQALQVVALGKILHVARVDRGSAPIIGEWLQTEARFLAP